MTDQTAPAAKQPTQRTLQIRASLRRRHLSEQIFRIMGIIAICAALGFVALLFTDVLRKGIPAFHQATLHLDITFDPEIIGVDPAPVQIAGQSAADFNAAQLAWQRNVAMLNWNNVITAAMTEAAPEGFEIDSRALLAIPETNARHVVREAFVADPSLLGQTHRFDLLASANVDNWVKGNIDRSLDDSRQQLPADTRGLVDILVENGTITQDFAWGLFTNVDSRAAPASAGLAGAFMGSLYMMLVVIVLAVPIGVASAIYLEEFAPKSRLTDLIEVNINNLAAVPSIVFGLLGAAVFINFFGLPRSAPLVGGLVLTLMTLPTIIIATRAALQAVSPALRQAALGLGASKTQMVFHHVLPVTFPSILTATIIGVAQALGETAPLLLIGMNAFVASIPGSPVDQATALPVQIFLWQGNENRNFFEARTSAAIMVLLGLMILLNAVAIFLRTRLERRA
ncbi:phosphate ABC transporter permease PstA [Devosia sp. XJ19-1]|uniref:Phosphate transport system permease protein PstA n=1 Tax=Devosia ureilytica TaxID=2952754 RepID=A0A9Q4ANC6_9HYPH|nr:phosphate ABC transporter permease PstA [Devosia ureilytica]MCP8883775.1 phosphate ABC transporter permease PstA [Devosia ureilytica]MCP8887383.1 phosphate ABC transporter permease PstA [Devosia ureilytica]